MITVHGEETGFHCSGGKGLGGGVCFPGGTFLVLRSEGLTGGWEGLVTGTCSDRLDCWEAHLGVSFHLLRGKACVTYLLTQKMGLCLWKN